MVCNLHGCTVFVSGAQVAQTGSRQEITAMGKNDLRANRETARKLVVRGKAPRAISVSARIHLFAWQRRGSRLGNWVVYII